VFGMIEVIGRDGRVHNFAEGTSQAQIDAAMAALYDPTLQPAPTQPLPPTYAQTTYPQPTATRGSNMMLIASAVAAGVIGLAAVVFIMGRIAPKPASEPAPQASGPAAVVTPTDPAAVAATDPNAALPSAPGAPAVTPEAFAGFVATVQGGSLTVRSQPQTTAPELAKLPHGAPVSVTGSVMMPDGLWRQVNMAGTTGFVKGQYVSQTQPAAIVRPPPAPAVQYKPLDEWGVISTMNSGSVNMRATPSTSAASIRALSPSTEVHIVGIQGNWYNVEYAGKKGWIRSDFVVGYD
jgi:uncharacterized protein YraI